jgi:hypothetical protein
MLLVMDLEGIEARDDCAGKDQKQSTRPAESRQLVILRTSFIPSFYLPSAIALLRGQRDQSNPILDRLQEFNTHTVE